MLNLGTPELLLIFVVALLVLGPTKLPEAARQLGRAMAQLRSVSAGFRSEMRNAMQEPVRVDPPAEPDATPAAPPAPTANPTEPDTPS